MHHPPFPRGATGREIQAIEGLHRVADRHREPDVREALSGAVELIVELIQERGRRRDMEELWDRSQDGG